MSGSVKKTGLREHLKALCPLVDKVRLMLGAARHAFNRHSQAELAKMASLQESFTLDIDPFFQLLESDPPTVLENQRQERQKLHTILSQLEFMAHQISGLAEPIRLKGQRGAILSDQDFYRVNDFFSQLTGLMRALVDIFQSDDPSLKSYVLKESKRLREACFREEADHETRMMDSPGQPGAWSVYVAILKHFRDSLGHLIALVETLQ